MKAKTLGISLLAVLFVVVIHESYVPSNVGNELGDIQYSVWILSDIHIRGDAQPFDGRSNREWFQIAVDDVNHNLKVDMVCVLGDIIDEQDSDVSYSVYEQIKDGAECKNWYEIAGNHDNLEQFQEHLGLCQYVVSVGSLLMVFMSDLSVNVSGKYPLAWWRNIVEANQDMNIFTFAHHTLYDTTCWSWLPNMYVEKSQEFTEVLEQYHVDAWFSGHIHNTWGQKWATKKGHTTFVNVAAITHKDVNFHTTSRVLYIYKNHAVVKFRNHDLQRFEEQWTYSFSLTYPFAVGG